MSDQNTDLDAVMRRIAKLLAIANDERANPGEAAAAAAMAEKAMRKYQLDHADVIERELRSKKPDLFDMAVFANMKRDDPKRPPLRKNPAWGQILAVAIAQLNDCHVMQGLALNKFKRLDSALIFMGYRPDVQVCSWTFDYVVTACIAGVKRFNDERKRLGIPDKVATANYRQGFIFAVVEALQNMKLSKDREQASSSRALVLVSTKLKVIEEQYGTPNYVQRKSGARYDDEAMERGRREGRQVNVNARGIGSDGNEGDTLKISG